MAKPSLISLFQYPRACLLNQPMSSVVSAIQKFGHTQRHHRLPATRYEDVTVKEPACLKAEQPRSFVGVLGLPIPLGRDPPQSLIVSRIRRIVVSILMRRVRRTFQTILCSHVLNIDYAEGIYLHTKELKQS
jgi:hypothetical protein